MYDDFLLNNSDDTISIKNINDSNLDTLFNNLTDDIASVNKFIADITAKKKDNEKEEEILNKQRLEVDRLKLEFENYKKITSEELKNQKLLAEQEISMQMDKVRKAEEDFRNNMSSTLSNLELEKKSLQYEKEGFIQEKEQFESYKKLELNKIEQEKNQLEQEKNKFEKYKDITTKKMELDSKNLEQKCLRFKEIMKQFSSNFKPVKEEE